jgi:hypothetical protein
MTSKLPIQIVMAVCVSACFPLGAASQTSDQSASNQPDLRPSIGAATTGLIEKRAGIGPDSLVLPGGVPAKPHEPLVTVAPSKIDLSILGYDDSLKGLHGLKIFVRNRTDRSLLLNSYKATATLSGVSYPACSAQKLARVITPPETFKKVLERDTISTATATFTVGAVQTAQDALLYAGPVLKRYGPDEDRRQTETETFGERILWPGDTTTGVVYFDTDSSLAGANINLPVQSFYDSNDSAQLTTNKRAQ